MRCPYCGFANADRATYCVSCGNSLIARSAPPAPSRAATPGTRTVTPASPQKPANLPPLGTPRRGQAPRTPIVETPVIPVAPPAPEPPAPFPPRTLEHLRALESGSLDYDVIDTTLAVGGKKIVRIMYTKCAAWQQMATLSSAFKKQREARFNTIIIQGTLTDDKEIYAFTNGQLTYDSQVRLGSQLLNRYQIETGNGYASDSIRVVLTEESKNS